MHSGSSALPFNGYMFDSSLLSEPTESRPLLVAVKEAARLLALKEVTIRKWIEKGRIHSVKLNAARRIPMTEIQRLALEGTAPN